MAVACLVENASRSLPVVGMRVLSKICFYVLEVDSWEREQDRKVVRDVCY